MPLRAMKFRVESPEHSEKIQKVLFDIGYDWEVGQEHGVKFTDKPGLCVYPSGASIYWLDESFEEHNNPEYTLKETISYELVPTQKPEELIELNGLKYKKVELEEALKLIKPIHD